MQISSTDIVIAAALSLASGRVAYSLARDGIFRPMREWIWLRSPGEGSMITLRGDDGDREVPARTMHYGLLIADRFYPGDEGIGVGEVGYHFMPSLPPRDPGWIGSLVECPYCLSFWTSLVAVAAWWLLGDDVIYPALPLAVWALANSYATKGL